MTVDTSDGMRTLTHWIFGKNSRATTDNIAAREPSYATAFPRAMQVSITGLSAFRRFAQHAVPQCLRLALFAHAEHGRRRVRLWGVEETRDRLLIAHSTLVVGDPERPRRDARLRCSNA